GYSFAAPGQLLQRRPGPRRADLLQYLHRAHLPPLVRVGRPPPQFLQHPPQPQPRIQDQPPGQCPPHERLRPTPQVAQLLLRQAPPAARPPPPPQPPRARGGPTPRPPRAPGGGPRPQPAGQEVPPRAPGPRQAHQRRVRLIGPPRLQAPPGGRKRLALVPWQ